LLAKYPEKYSIGNIGFRHGIEYVKKMDYFNNVGGWFNEIGGLKWKDKVVQIRESKKKIEQNTGNRSFILQNDQLNFLFDLYSRFGDKKSIRREYDRAIKKEQLKQYVNPNWLFWKLKKRLFQSAMARP
jgi:hypothetical protein